MIAPLLANVERDRSTNPEQHSSDIRNLDAAVAVEQINLSMIDDDDGEDFVEEEDEDDEEEDADDDDDNDLNESPASTQSTNEIKFQPIDPIRRMSYVLPSPPPIAKVIPHPTPFHESSFHPTFDIAALAANVCSHAMPPLYTVEREPISEPAPNPTMSFRAAEPTGVTWENKLKGLKSGKYAEPDKKMKRKIRTYQQKKSFHQSLPKKQQPAKTMRRMKECGCVRVT